MGFVVFHMTGLSVTYLIENNDVSYQNTKSSYENAICDVSQGSILSPLLFILYMNHTVFTSSLLTFILFADDTTVFHSNDDISVLYD